MQVAVASHVRNFEEIDLDEVIYATGWDGTVRVLAKDDGTYEVETTR